jgi:hypothetical protein
MKLTLSTGQEITVNPARGENAFRLMAIYSRYFPEMMDSKEEEVQQMIKVFSSFSDEKISDLFATLKKLFTGCVVELDQVIQNDEIITDFGDTMAILNSCQSKKD